MTGRQPSTLTHACWPAPCQQWEQLWQQPRSQTDTLCFGTAPCLGRCRPRASWELSGSVTAQRGRGRQPSTSAPTPWQAPWQRWEQLWRRPAEGAWRTHGEACFPTALRSHAGGLGGLGGSAACQSLVSVGSRQWGHPAISSLLRVKIYDFAVYIDGAQVPPRAARVAGAACSRCPQACTGQACGRRGCFDRQRQGLVSAAVKVLRTARWAVRGLAGHPAGNGTSMVRAPAGCAHDELQPCATSAWGGRRGSRSWGERTGGGGARPATRPSSTTCAAATTSRCRSWCAALPSPPCSVGSNLEAMEISVPYFLHLRYFELHGACSTQWIFSGISLWDTTSIQHRRCAFGVWRGHSDVTAPLLQLDAPPHPLWKLCRCWRAWRRCARRATSPSSC